MGISEETFKRMEELELENKELRKRLSLKPEDTVSIGHSEDHPKYPCSQCKRLFDVASLKKSLCSFCVRDLEIKSYEDANKNLSRYSK